MNSDEIIKGTYKPDDVTLLLKDVTDLVTPVTTEEKERLIQSGTHYSELLQKEWEPSNDYLEFYRKTLDHFSPVISQLVATVSAEIIKDKWENTVLVSLARAGTPIGILIKRYIKYRWDIDVPHYTISIIRDKGIDKNAMNYIVEKHYHALQMSFQYNYYGISDDPCFFVSRNAAAFGRVTAPKGIIVWIDPMPYQIEAEYSELSDLCKGEGATEQAEALAQLIQFNQGKRGLVYINRHKVREWVLPFLDKAGISYRCINGRTPNDEREEILKEFNEDKSVDIIITSVTEALDLDCDYVIFYEFTSNIKQMIGRAQRGFTDKNLFVFYMITDKTKEVDYFYNNIYKHCEVASYVLRKDYSEVLDLEDELLEHLTHPEQYVYWGW